MVLGLFFRDLWERVLATYFEVFVGLLIAGWADVARIGTISVVEKALVAAVPAGLAALKAFIAKSRGNASSASLSSHV